MRTRILAGCLTALVASAGLAAADESDTLIQLDKEWGDAPGAEALDSLLSEEIVALNEEGMVDKDWLLEDAAANPPTESYEAGDYEVDFLGDDVAVMVHSVAGPEPHWSMHVWQKQDGNWKAVATATVPVEE